MHEVNKNIRRVFALVCILFAILALYLGDFILFDSKEIVNNPYNPRVRLLAERVLRGSITDRTGVVLASGPDDARAYPAGSSLAHLVGSVHMGKSGVEHRYNALLQYPSMEAIQRLNILRGGGQVMGDTVVLTVDEGIQELVYSAFGRNRGAAVVMEPATGRILAMVSKPDFDPSRLDQDWDSLTGDAKSSTLVNRATQGLYPPGSVFKTLTAAAAMENGLAAFVYECDGTAELDGGSIRCNDAKAHGTVDLTKALAVSCNGYFAAVTLEMGADGLRAACERAYFNHDLSYEIERGQSVFRLAAGAPAIDIIHTAIGQGQTVVTPLHMCMVASSIANGGRMMKPYVFVRRVSAAGFGLGLMLPQQLGQAFDADTAAALTGMMVEAVETGTASAAAVPGVRIAAKTGTAETGAGDAHGWVIAFAPADAPQIAIAVVMENAGGPKKGLALVRQVVEEIVN